MRREGEMTKRRRRQFQAECQRKARYPSLDAAWSALGGMLRKGYGDAQMRPYRCPVKGGHFHLGHRRSLTLDRAFRLVEAS
jgi:hypothetical protein